MTPSALKSRLDTRMQVLAMLHDGLNGRPFHWGSGESKNYFPIAQELGVTLLTKTAIEKRGWHAKRGAKPVGWVYFGAPIQQDCAVYIWECQSDYGPSPGKRASKQKRAPHGDNHG